MLAIPSLSILDWLRLADYDDALRHARVGVIKRFARGNVSFQNGNLIDDEGLDELRAEGDRAMSDLKRHLAAHIIHDRDNRLRANA